MEFIIIAICVQILPLLLLDALSVHFMWFATCDIDDWAYWVLSAIICIPLYTFYARHHLVICKNHWLAWAFAVVCFALVGVFAMAAVLFFHVKILNAPL